MSVCLLVSIVVAVVGYVRIFETPVSYRTRHIKEIKCQKKEIKCQKEEIKCQKKEIKCQKKRKCRILG